MLCTKLATRDTLAKQAVSTGQRRSNLLVVEMPQSAYGVPLQE